MSTKPSDLESVFAWMRETAEFDMRELRSVHDRGNLGNMPLHVAAAKGDVAAINCLLDNGADIDSVGEFGETPLHIAVQMKHAEAVKTLLRRGASRDIRNDLGRTPLELAHEVMSPIAALF